MLLMLVLRVYADEELILKNIVDCVVDKSEGS